MRHHSRMYQRFLTLCATVTLLSGCDRLDTLSVVESPDGLSVISDSVGVSSGSRVICVRPKRDIRCARSNAEILVEDRGAGVNVQANWEGNDRVVVQIDRGKAERASTSARNGNVRIDYR